MNKPTINFNNNEKQLNIFKPTIGRDCLDINDFTSNGYFVLDEGFTGTANCRSKITYIDGEKGTLLHRGYPIEQLAKHSEYLEVGYLLLNGELPTKQEYEAFRTKVDSRTRINDNIAKFFKGFLPDAHPMAMLSAVIAALSTFHNENIDIDKPEDRELTIHRILAKIPILVAMCYKYSIGAPYVNPDTDRSFAGNFLNMMFGTADKPYHNPIVEKAMDVILTLHADHEQNASTATVRLAGSTGCSPFVAIASGVSALWGPLHGGANESVIRMLLEIGDYSNVGAAIKRAKDKSDSFRLMGFGHRVYKNFDPRSKIIKEICDSVLKDLKINDPLLDIAKKLEEHALQDPYFVDRKLYPNVDFYSGIVLRAIGIPLSMFTTIFALGRSVGWLSHWKEMKETNAKLSRPRQLYIGSQPRDFVPIEQR